MTKNIDTAFEKFLADTVNLDSDESKTARSSRGWLIDRVHEFDGKYEDFPALYNEKDIAFGSFSRRTKKRPLDDIDIMICMNAADAFYTEFSDKIEITVPESSKNFRKLCFDGTDKLSSRKVINKFIENLKSISQYENSEINRNQEACTLKLKSYSWNFDVVPCFFTSEDSFGNIFYMIPDGDGNWKKTDPRIDKDKTTRINQKHDGYILNIIRIFKYWNKRPTMPSMSSYLLENMILDYYDGKNSTASSYIDLEILDVLDYIRMNIFNSVDDPKGIQGDLNVLTIEERDKISTRAFVDLKKAKSAREYERNDNLKSCFNQWKAVFGDKFPEYG